MSAGETSSEPWPHDMAALLARLDAAYKRVDQTISALSYSQLTALRDGRGWSVKDHLAHLVVWERGTLYLLQKLPRYAGLGIDEATYLGHDGDELNIILHGQSRSWSLETDLAAFKRVHQDLALVLAGLNYDDLRLTYSHYQPHEPGKDDGRPILAWVAAIADHQEEHLVWIKQIVTSSRVEDNSASVQS